MSAPTSADPWNDLRRFTSARIALGRVGSSLPTKEILEFGAAHAMARDAVNLSLDAFALEVDIQSLGFSTLRVHSKAPDRQTFLLSPDLGRRLDDASRQLVQTRRRTTPVDLAIVVGDGLSSLAIQRNAVPFLSAFKECIPYSWNVGPVVIAEQARVALADEVGERMNARMTIILIGERPGLSSPDSLGIYLTYAPDVGRSDAERNCISNVRPEGLSYTMAANRLIWLAKAALQLKATGVVLKDQSDIQKIGA